MDPRLNPGELSFGGRHLVGVRFVLQVDFAEFRSLFSKIKQMMNASPH